MPARSKKLPSESGHSLILRLLVFFIILLIILLVATRVGSRTWYIKADGSGDAPTVQAGVDSASAGDSVVVYPGAYGDTTHVWVDGELKAVCVHLYKDIKLIGRGPGSTILGSPDADIALYAEYVDVTAVVKGFRITTDSGWYG